MKNKHIIVMLLIVCVMFIMPITVYAGEILNTDKEGLNTDTIEMEGTISMLDDSGNVKNSLKKYGKAYINTYPENRGYLWVCLIKGYGGLQVCYYGGDSFQTIDKGVYIQSAQSFGNPPTLEKPSYSLDVSEWTCSSLSSPYQFGEFMMWFGSECEYEFNINVDSSLPIYYKSFNSMTDYADWYHDEGFNLDKFPAQDYSTTGFTVKGDLDDGTDYDLEVPLEIKCKGFDMAVVGATNGLLALRPYFTWTQSDSIDVQDWYTESYVRIVGKNKKYPWNSWVDFDTGYVKAYGLFTEVPNYKRKILYKGDDWDTSCLKPPNEETRKGTSAIERYYVRTRNYWYDEKNKRMHYSNWVTWYIDEDGKMHCVENKDHDVTNTDDDGNVIIDSSNYNPTEDYEEKNKGKDTVSSISLDSFLDSLKQAISTIGDIPNMLGAVFSWLPPIFISIIVTGIGLLILLRILGR